MARRKPNLNLPRNRPQIPIDWKVVDYYLEAGCLGTEIAGILGCSPDTVYERCVQEKGMTFTAYSAEKRSKGDARIREKQYLEAIAGDKSMLIWLGKNRLLQKDKHEISGDQANPLMTVINTVDGKTKELVNDKSE